MGRAPCCDKANVKKGPWSPDEDAKLKSYIESNGTGGNWIALPQKIGIKRCGKSCRLRWLNYLRPNIRHGGFTEEEDNIICSLYLSIGSRWSIIAAQLPGRTDNDIKNYWNTKLKKKLLGKQRKEQQARRASCFTLKQEMKSETENYMVPGAGMVLNQAIDWPLLPPPVNQDPHQIIRGDQDSIRNLLVKLGGRFSNEHHHHQVQQSSTMNFQYPLHHHVPFAQHQLYDQNSMNMLSSESSLTTCSQVTNTTTTTTTAHFNVTDVGGVGSHDVFQGLDSLQAELSELICNSNEQILDEFEGFYGTDNIVDGSGTATGTSSVESSSWGDIAYPQIVSGFEASQQQSIPHVSTFDDSSYFGPQ